MEQFGVYIILFATIVVVGQLFYKSSNPISLILVIAGMLLSLWPQFPKVQLNPELVLDIFLPILLYQISSFSAWNDVKKNLQPIILLSIGHVIFITILVAVVIHAILPQLSWPLAFVLGSVISPPDDVAIVSIAEKFRIPERIVTILEGEGLLNDATALILFRFSLAAVTTHFFSPGHALAVFLMVIVGETLYGLVLGLAIGELRTKIHNPMLHMIASLLTPFLAYVPATALGGSGVIATVITGFVIGNRYSVKFTPEFRLMSRAIWPTLSFAIQSLIFLLIGLNLNSILQSIASIPWKILFLSGSSVVATVILGRFFWVFVVTAYGSNFIISWFKKRIHYPPWQFPFIVSWAGMRGGISMAAAFAVPVLPSLANGANPRDLLIFLVFCVIASTLLLQGLTLPWVMKKIGLTEYGKKEKFNEHRLELKARIKLTSAVLRWLKTYREEVKEEPRALQEVKLYIHEYQMRKLMLKENLDSHNELHNHDDAIEVDQDAYLVMRMIDIEREQILELWKKEEINQTILLRLMDRLDHRMRHIST